MSKRKKSPERADVKMFRGMIQDRKAELHILMKTKRTPQSRRKIVQTKERIERCKRFIDELNELGGPDD